MDWFARGRRRVRGQGSGLIEEASALLTGQLDNAGTGTPVWARVNSLAHARPLRLLHECQVRRRNTPEPLGSWARARSDILEELVDLAGGRSQRIEQLQRECLIPLELRLMEPHLANLLPSDVLVLALTRLRAHPISMDHWSTRPPDA
jgi:hypothetical protein